MYWRFILFSFFKKSNDGVFLTQESDLRVRLTWHVLDTQLRETGPKNDAISSTPLQSGTVFTAIVVTNKAVCCYLPILYGSSRLARLLSGGGWTHVGWPSAV